MRFEENNVTYGIQKEFDTYTKIVLKFIVSNILAKIKAKNELRPEILYMEDLYMDPVYETISTDVEKIGVRSGDDTYFLNNEFLAKALKRLNRKNREIVLLYYFAGIKHKEIVDIVGLPVDVVYNRKARSLKQLKRFILEEEKNARES